MNKDKILEIIKENKKDFPVNLSLINPRKETKNEVKSIFIKKYNCLQLLNDDFYKKISRMI
ncbi:MAG: hypothetical protein LBV69_12280 [Bacteroidales bacterium]|jgi:hypothetical protein|nr:hypothetical protein [Bacteroidales bacterium]